MAEILKIDNLSRQQKRFRNLMALSAFLFASVFLALSVWVVRETEEDHLLRAARNYSNAIESFRNFYTEVIVSPLVGHPWVIITEHYRDQGGAIPIPATMTIDLVDYMSQRDETIDARLVSDFPFPQRADRLITPFDIDALEQMREQNLPEFFRFQVDDQGKELVYATPIKMLPTCVTCHNNHKDSPKRDWQVGDVRGIQVVTMPASQNVLAQSGRFLYLISFVVLAFISALFALFFMDGRVRKTIKLLFDRNRKLEFATKELKQQQNALDQHAIVSMTDRAGNIIYTNQHFKNISGYEDDELIGKNHRIINSGHHSVEMFEALWHTIVSGQVWHGEIKNVNKQGCHYWVKATIMPLYDADGQIDRYISIRTDITQQKQLEQDLKQTNDELNALNKTLDEARKEAVAASEAKSAFLANMSHEIRTPMTGIIGMTDLALDTELTPAQRDYLDVVKSSADALLAILNDILDFSKIDAGKLQISPINTDVKVLLSQCLKPVAMLAEKKGITLVVDIQSNVPDCCLIDPVRVRQVLVNICDNAIKFTAEGEVRVTIGWQAIEGSSGELYLGVKDQGIGISKSQQKHIFQAFSQADDSTTRRFGGTGLGLTITARLVELMQGEIGVESEPGQGSLFWIKLPCQQIDIEPEDVMDKSQTSSSESAPLNILLVEDNKVNQKLITTLLSKRGHCVTLAENGQEAVDICKESTFDMILMDMQMPVMGGVEAASHIRKNERVLSKPPIPIFAMTANVLPTDKEACLNAGMNGHLGKPVKLTELDAVLDAVKRSKTHD
ncbi:ATP-binding protein [Nitrincola schmidtii]|uniref:ATP-binding protein n=1 Tax=Nitrincola schmidtii TaxID=1730894 RepID=UPI00124E6235|nr:ATP-binding protein [Nitrincola schmidtii]